MLNPPMSPLLRLPAELRNLIYSYVFAHQTIEPVPELWRQRNDTTIRVHNVLTLLRVNRQLHAETRLLPYQNTTFVFTSTYALDAFVARRSQEQLDFIQSVQINLMLQDEKFWEPEQFRSLSRMPALKHIDVVDVQEQCANKEWRAKRLRRMAECIREWRPEVRIVARDFEGRWTMDSNDD